MGRLSDKVFEAVSAGIVHINSELQIVQHNRLGALFLASDEDANLVGKLFSEVAANHTFGLKIAFEKVLADKKKRKFWGYPVAPANLQSEKTYWDYTVSALDDGVVLSAVEVTDRVNAERGLQNAIEEARQSTEKLKSVVGQMADGVVVCNRDGQVSRINEAAVNLLGDAALAFYAETKGVENLAGRLRQIDESPLASEQYPWNLACEKGETIINQEILVKREADQVILSVSAAPLFDADEKISGSVTVLRDVTENRQLILELQQANQRLEEYNRLKAEFVANMSHELRTPLTAIIGFAQLMQMRHEKGVELQKNIGDGLERILRNGRHLLTLIDEVLDLSKIEAGRLTLHLDHFDLPELIEQTFSGLESLAIEKKIGYRLKVSGDFPFSFSDSARIRQIVMNLLSNAIKFTEQGKIEAELKPRDEQEWELTVKDSGTGIESADLEKIFERFRQVDGSYTRAAGGFGLGLSISRQLAELLGGRIKVESEYGAGSTFRLILPFIAPRAIKTLSENSGGGEADKDFLNNFNPDSDADGRQTVLVIDDLPDSTQLLSQMLENAGYRVIIAHSGAEGIQMARKFMPDAITLDVMMPGMDGWRVMQQMKSDTALAQIPIVVVSIVDNKPLGYRLGASDYLVKPVAPGNLLETLNSVVIKSADAEGRKSDYVLVVDDEQGVRELLIAALKQGGFQTRSAPSGEIGFAMAQKETPIAILTDLHMPGGMSGYEFIARLRAQTNTLHTPIVIITGKDLMTEDRHLLSGQIADVIRKGDLMLADLEDRLRETLAEIGVKPTNGDNNAG